MSTTSLQCPSCGRHDLGIEEQCECGFVNNNTFITELEKESINTVKRKSQKNTDKPININHNKKLFIKEIDSWEFTFSQEDDCINLSTPALNEFKLKITLKDLEELLEYVYMVTGSKKTVRNLQLPVEAISDVVAKVNRLIEEKRSKISIKLDEDELNGIGELINNKLME